MLPGLTSVPERQQFSYPLIHRTTVFLSREDTILNGELTEKLW
jgi:hypothetical protein